MVLRILERYKFRLESYKGGHKKMQYEKTFQQLIFFVFNCFLPILGVISPKIPRIRQKSLQSWRNLQIITPYKIHQNTAAILQDRFGRCFHHNNNRQGLHKGDKTHQGRACRVVHRW